MNIQVLREAGYSEALLGLSLSYNSEPSKRVADRLAFKGGGESKFLESMMVWLDINAARYWWQQFDTYRAGTTKQSGSTMHTLMRRTLVPTDFEWNLDESVLGHINSVILNKDFDGAKALLPESFLQRRIVCTNYKTLQNMVWQRKDHKLIEWKYFIAELEDQLLYKEFIFIKDEDTNEPK